MELTINKFGGGCLKKGEGIDDVLSIISRQGKQINVFSAFQGITDNLENYADQRYYETLKNIKGDYLNIAKTRLSEKSLKNFEESLTKNEIGQSLDAILSKGEKYSTEFMYHVLKENQFNVERIDINKEFPIVTNNYSGDADPILEETRKKSDLLKEKLKDSDILLVPGFVGITLNNEITTLGRGGSDCTAVVLADAMKTDYEVQTLLWKEEPGVLAADPSIVKNPKTIPKLSYSEAANLSKFGAKIIQFKAMDIASKEKIKIKIPYLKDEGKFTIIGEEGDDIVKGITGTKNGKLITIDQENSGWREYCKKNKFSEFLFPTGGDFYFADMLVVNKNDVEKIPGSKIERDVGIVALVGDRMRETTGIISKATEKLSKINIYGVNAGIKDSYILFAVDQKDFDFAVKTLYDSFLRLLHEIW